MTRRGTVLLLALVAIFGSAACGSDNKVGDKALLDFKDQAQTRLGETTTTTAAPTTTTAKGAVTTTTKPKAGAGAAAGAAATTTTVKARTAQAAPPPTTPAAVESVREIHIYGDDAELALDPQIQTAYTGSVIRWVNKDSVPRAVRADSGQFASPMIQPGASWDYTAATVGTFAYADDTRPYVKGELRVAKKP
jgi:plastocyanin